MQFSINRILKLLGLAISPVLISNPTLQAKESTTSRVIFTDTNTVVSRKIIDSLDHYYTREIARGFNGSVLIGHKGKVIYKRHFGYADRSKGMMLGDKVSTQLSSTSKPFTATAILWLYQNKYLDINFPVNTYLRDFPYPNITVKMLLNHTSGLPNYTSTKLPLWKSKEPMYSLDLQNYLATFRPKLINTPGSKFKYCNTNYALLARIVEEVSGIPFKQFLQELIFEPLNMKNTFVYDPKDDYSDRAISISYNPNWTIFHNNHEDGVYGDKGIFSTVEDMYLWDQALYQNKILSQQTLRLAFSGIPVDNGGIKKYGLGWRMYDFKNGQKLIFHNGRWHGNNSVFYRFIDENTTIIVLGNRFNTKIYQQGKAVYKILRSINPKAFTYTFDNENDMGVD
ncbi:MAG TPA: serine hydrolase domain-containing protein [Edaphocola sp.]|nr:serine hydrolase domain-containing protein [Edaphocola sp.]